MYMSLSFITIVTQYIYITKYTKMGINQSVKKEKENLNSEKSTIKLTKNKNKQNK